MKDLTKDAVRRVAEELMEKYQTTTTLDVKNRLRGQGYQAFQKDVSTFMNMLASQDNWSFHQQGSYRVYRFGPDTNQVLQTYLENRKLFVEIKAEGKEMIVGEGLVGTNGVIEVKVFRNNRKTIRIAQSLINQKLNEGYQEAKDERLPLLLRKKFGDLLTQRAKMCAIAYFNLKKTEEQKALFKLETSSKTGLVKSHKNLGCQFSWDLSTQLNTVSSLLNQQTWQIPGISYQDLKILGEKTLNQHFYVENEELKNQPLSVELQDSPQISQLSVDNNNMFQIDFTMENGENLSLNKFDLKMQEELLPIAKKILEQSI